MKKAMIDVAYDLMKPKKKAMTFIKLWDEVCQINGYTDAQAEDRIAQFYSDLSLDDRFVNVGKNSWDLKERHTYKEVVINTEDIIIEEDVEEEFVVEVEEIVNEDEE